MEGATHLIEPIKNEVELISFDCIYGTTIRVWVNIKGMVFKRVYDRSGLYPPVWSDEEGNIGDTISIQDPQKENELEEIFKAFCLEQKLDFIKLTNKKQLH